jgi:hypothetical protein
LDALIGKLGFNSKKYLTRPNPIKKFMINVRMILKFNSYARKG